MPNIVPYNNNQSLQSPRSFTSERGGSIESVIGGWLDEKKKRSNSPKTQTAYFDTITAFRQQLQRAGLDLIYVDKNFVYEISDHAQVFAGMRSEKATRRSEITPATQAQRLAILSSFYKYAIKRGHVSASNPIEKVDRPPVEQYGQAQALSQHEVSKRLQSIDASTPQGARDLALLSVLLATGRRVSEIASLTIGNIKGDDDELKLIFPHTKGGKIMKDTLTPEVADVLAHWILLHFQAPLTTIPPDSRIWFDVEHPTRKNEPLGYHGISGVCNRYLGSTKVHMTRHTFAVLMEQAGAKLTDIQRRLGHKNPATTGIYLQQLTQDRNEYAGKVANLLGFKSKE